MKKSREYERVLPLNPDLEKAALHAVMHGRLDPKCIKADELSKVAKPIYKTLVKLYSGNVVPTRTVLATATEIYHADPTETKQYLKEVDGSDTPEIQGILQTLSHKRIINQIVNEASDQVASGEYSLLALRSLLDQHGTARQKLTPLLDKIGKEKAGPPQGVPVPCLPRLTQTVGGVYGMWLIQGEPAAGKSTLALQVAMSVGRRRPVLYYDFEQGESVIQWHIEEALEGDEGKIEEATKQLYVRYNLSTIEQDIASVEQPCLIVVDSIQSVSSSVMHRRESIDSWIHKLHALKQYGHHVILVSEKRRGTYGQPALDGGKESGELEYKADTAFDLLLEDEQDGSRVQFHITKNRHYKKKGLLGIYERVNSWWFREVGQRTGVD